MAQSIVDTGDTGKAFTKGTEVTATIEALKAKGYTVVENNYPEMVSLMQTLRLTKNTKSL